MSKSTTNSTTSTGPPRPFVGHPFSWLLFSIMVLLIPVAGAMWRSGMAWDQMHPAVNALLNSACSVFLFAGYYAIRKGDHLFHRSCMVSAVATSGAFLVSYVTRYMMTGTHRYGGDGWDKGFYLFILMTHMVLAVVVLPLVMRALWMAYKGRFDAHKRVVKWLWPIWVYVSVTGVIVYLMLYQL